MWAETVVALYVKSFVRIVVRLESFVRTACKKEMNTKLVQSGAHGMMIALNTSFMFSASADRSTAKKRLIVINHRAAST